MKALKKIIGSALYILLGVWIVDILFDPFKEMKKSK